MDLSETNRPEFKVCKGFDLPGSVTDMHIIPVSGGADSTWLAILMHKLFPSVNFTLLFTDTHAEEPEIYESLDRLEAFLGKKIERISHDLGLFGLISKYGGFLPSGSARFCTKDLKLLPFQKWLKKHDHQNKYIYVGIRADETFRVAFTLKDAETVMPFIELGMKREDIFNGLSRTIGIPKFYTRRTRSGCSNCPMQRLSELVGLQQERPIEFHQGQSLEKVSKKDLDRWTEAVPLWKDSGLARNWQTLPVPHEGDIEKGRLAKATDLFGNRIWVAAEFFMDGMPGCGSFIWHQRVISFSPSLHHIMGQIDDRYQHLLSTCEVYGMTTDDVRRDAKFAIYYVELSSEVFDPTGPNEQGSYTWRQGMAYKQIAHVVGWATRALHAEGLRQQAAKTVRSELTVQYEWIESSKAALAQTTEEVGSILLSQWYAPSEVEREMDEEEVLTTLPCPMCSL